MINSNQKIDLHIHSFASKYKETEGIVDESTTENLDVLFDKLEDNNISLFSITDHNRIDPEIYSRAKEIIASKKYPCVKEILTGVEFDVCLDKKLKPCHIITIFDTRSISDIKLIQYEISQKLLSGKEDYYAKDDFEQLLKNIGLNTILISHQKQSLEKKTGGHKSLSESTQDPYKALEVGYISALEYQNSGVQGILKKELKKINRSVPLLTGSDCHDWRVYPYHDKLANNRIEQFTSLKCLPTFKGLLMCISSPETRVNRMMNDDNRKYINSFNVDGKDYQLDIGINAIIGENGSGKSTLMHLLANHNVKPYMKKISKSGDFSLDTGLSEGDEYIVEQSAIIEEYNESGKNNLFPTSLFTGIDNTDFENEFQRYSSDIKKFILRNIEMNDTKKLLEYSIEIKPELEDKTYFVIISDANLTENIDVTEPSTRYKSLLKIYKNISEEVELDFYNEEQKSIFKDIQKKMLNLIHIIGEDYYKQYYELTIKNIIEDECNNYSTKITSEISSIDQEIMYYGQEKQKLIDNVIKNISAELSSNPIPKQYKVVKEISKNTKNGFVFVKKPLYDNNDITQEYFKKMFNSDYKCLNDLLNINTKLQFKIAVRECGDIKKIDDCWDKNANAIKNGFERTQMYILDAKNNYKQGATLGEMSLTFYKFNLSGQNTYPAILIDQPEDNISNLKITEDLRLFINTCG